MESSKDIFHQLREARAGQEPHEDSLRRSWQEEWHEKTASFTRPQPKIYVIMTDNFLNDDYEIPKGPTSYTKFDPGDHKLRILSAPLMGWVSWKDKKPVRHAMTNRPEPAPKDLKHFWAVIVWNYATMQIEIAEITQKALQTTLKDLNKNADWGAPYAYDVTIKRVGTTINDTEYSLLPSPKKPIGAEVVQAFKDKPIQLDLLLSSDDPFTPKGTPTAMAAVEMA